MFVGTENVVASTEGADQHQQGGLGEVEVGEHCLHHFEFETYFEIWIDEQVCRGGAGEHGSCADANGVFESADRRGADGDDATRCGESLVDGRGRGGRD